MTDLGCRQPELSAAGHPGLLQVRPDGRPVGDDRRQEPQRQEPPDHAGRRQRQRAGHRRGRLNATSPRTSRTLSPRSSGTYYVEITGDPGVKYSLTVTRSANFDIEPNNTIDHGPEPGRHQRSARGAQSGRHAHGRAELRRHRLPRLELRLLAAGHQRGGRRQRTSSKRSTSRSASSTRRRARSSTTSHSPTFFGAGSGGDPYVVYDDIADRWYVSAFDS